MFIIKHIYQRGSSIEEVFPGVSSVVYDAEKKTLSATLVNPPSFMYGNVYTMDSGIVYLINESGETVETYHLDEGKKKVHEKKPETKVASGLVYAVSPKLKRMTLWVQSFYPDGALRNSVPADVYLGDSFDYDSVKVKDEIEVHLVRK